MSKRKYILKREDLYNTSNNDFILEKNVQQKPNSTIQKAENLIKRTEETNKLNSQKKIQKENDQPQNLVSEEKNQFIEGFLKPNSLIEEVKKPSKESQSESKQITALKQKVLNKIPNKKNTPIAFSSSIHKTPQMKSQAIKSNVKKSKSKQKSVMVHKNKTNDKSSQKQLNFSQSVNLTSRSTSARKRIVKQKLLAQNSSHEEKNNLYQNNCDDGQCLKIDSMIASEIQESEKKQKLISQNLTIKKQKQPLISQTYLKQIDSQLHFLETQLQNYELKNKQLQQILAGRQAKLDEQQKECIRLYKENQDLSDMIRDMEQLKQKKSIQFEKSLFQTNLKLKQKEDQYKILETERDTLLRKKDRMNQEISKLYETIKLKDAEILSEKQKEEFLISQNQQLITAYERIKHQLEEALKINQTEIFFKNLIKKGEQQTQRNHMEMSAFRCSRCHQTILGNQTTAEELAMHHMNEKFKKHIKTYEDEVKYWKDELQFMKTQHQHEIENIRTVLQCTFQKNLLEKETKYGQEISELKKTILIQEELITNYKGVIERRQKTSREELQSQTQRSQPTQQKRESIFRMENFETTRSRSYLTDRKVIQQVLAEEEENRPRQNRNIIRIKQNEPDLGKSLLTSNLCQDEQTSILESFRRKVQLSESSLNSRITRNIETKDRKVLQQLKN